MLNDDDDRPQGFEDKTEAELRQLRRLKKRELDIAEKQLQATQGPQFVSLPAIAMQFVPAVEAAHPRWSPEKVVTRACDLVAAYAKEVTRRWAVPAALPGPGGPHG